MIAQGRELIRARRKTEYGKRDVRNENREAEKGAPTRRGARPAMLPGALEARSIDDRQMR